MAAWRSMGGLVVALALGCGSSEVSAPPPIVARSTETLPAELVTKKEPPPESTSVSSAKLFADEPEAPRGRNRRKRRRRRQPKPPRSLVRSDARSKSEGEVALRHRVSSGARASDVDDETLKVIQKNRHAISLCVADASRRGERTTGKMEVEVAVDGRGRVRKTELLSEAYVGTILGTCVLRRIKEWRFAETGRSATLVLPFVVEAAY